MLRIRDIREDKELTQKQLSQILNCTQQTYSRYETGEITIDIYNLIKLANFYNTSTDYLLGLTNEIKPYKRKENWMETRLRNLREDNNKKQIELANYLNCKQNTYQQYESGTRQIPLEKLKKLALLYNTSIDYIVKLTDEIKPYKRKM